ncbi:MAG TPA: BlaI/MecI/CopY family transcriptional regulator [Bryobacteraceae bacterium]
MPAFAELGPLEQAVVESLWILGEASVQDVAKKLERPLAYTTVMTTLDRLFKKGVLERRQVERAFHYQPRFSRLEMERRTASAFVDGFLIRESGEMLFSCLVDAVGQYDAALLDELEEKIREKRLEMEQQRRKQE